jgi:hypothetical protein
MDEVELREFRYFIAVPSSIPGGSADLGNGLAYGSRRIDPWLDAHVAEDEGMHRWVTRTDET